MWNLVVEVCNLLINKILFKIWHENLGKIVCLSHQSHYVARIVSGAMFAFLLMPTTQLDEV